MAEDEPIVELDDIQGNVLGGFRQDFQSYLFLRFRDSARGRDWLRHIASSLHHSREVLKHNAEFRAAKQSGVEPKPVTWLNLAITYTGMQALELPAAELARFPAAFREGMKSRASRLGDEGESSPERWNRLFLQPDVLHAMLIVAADTREALVEALLAVQREQVFVDGVRSLDVIHGKSRADLPGHEHFGYRDGVSQPRVRGVATGQPDNAGAGPLVWPGEFVLGYPQQIPTAVAGKSGPNPGPGATSGPDAPWAKNGSYLVFRRLKQDVAGFATFVQKLAADLKETPEMAGARLVGRFPSGYPLSKLTAAERANGVDPGMTGVVADDSTLNDFGFAGDADGVACPLASHIRKVNPRDHSITVDAASSESEVQTHRLMRRGLPYEDAGERGLLFLAYQSDLERQFEFVQGQWANNVEFPRAQTGRDALIAQAPLGTTFVSASHEALRLSSFVTTTGGEYFFAPSRRALEVLALL